MSDNQPPNPPYSTSTVNDQIIDVVHESRRSTVNLSDRQSIAFIDTVAAETMGMSLHNAVAAQRQAQILNAAAVATTCARLLSVAGGKPAPPTPSPVPPILTNPFAPPGRPSLRELISLAAEVGSPGQADDGPAPAPDAPAPPAPAAPATPGNTPPSNPAR